MAKVTVASVLRKLGLIVSGAAVLALTLGVAGFAWWLPQPETTELALPPQAVGVGPTTWVCAPAPALATEAVGVDVPYDPALGTGGGRVEVATEVVAVGQGQAPMMTFGGVGEDAAAAESAATLATVSSSDVSTSQVARVEPTDDGVPLVGGLSLARADAGDLRGLSASTCQRPVTTAMLVGGSTQVGSTARLVLSNAGETAASVTVTGWGATGPLPRVAPFVVPAGGVRAILLETISLEPRLAIRIDVEGGQVVPTIQDSSLNGIVAAGTETIPVAADPATTLSVGGVNLTDAAGAAATLRLVNPGTEPATVTVETLGADGPHQLEGAVDSVIEPGTVVDISLAGVQEGTYSVRVTSDVPVAGAVRIARTGTAGEIDPDVAPVDIAWLPASAPMQRGILPIPTQLVDAVDASVTNPGEEAIEVGVSGYDTNGQPLGESTLNVAAGSTVPLDIPVGALALVLEGDGFVASAVVSANAADGPMVAAYPIVADPTSEQSVTVRVTG